MSLPSIKKAARRLRINLTSATPEQNEQVLVAAMRRDLPLAVKRLEAMTDEAKEKEMVMVTEDPASPIGKQLTRVFAGTVLRDIAAKHFCGGKKLAFLNCCSPVVSSRTPSRAKLMDLQIKLQDGTLAHADC